MSGKRLSLLKKIVNYNKEFISENNGVLNDDVIDEIIILDYKGHSIWNPFKDETSRFKVDPVKKYGKEKIDKFINDYKEKTG